MVQLRRWSHLVVLCGTFVVLYFSLPATLQLPADAVVARGVLTLACLALLGYLVARQLRLQIDEGMDRRVDGLILSVVGVVVVFAFAFYLLARRDPQQVVGLQTRIDALYFTLSTLSTVGYGDIHANGQAARALVIVQMVFNVVFVTSAAGLLSRRIRRAAAQRSASRRAEGQD